MIRVMAEQIAVPTEKFLKEVQNRPCLWDPTHSLFKNVNARKLSFRLIVDKLIENVPHSKKDEIGGCLSRKWKGIYDHYVKVMCDPSTTHKYSNNRYFQLLGFLEPTLPSSILEKARVHDTSSQVSSSSSHSGKSPTSQSSSSTNEVCTSTSHNEDQGCDPEETARAPNINHTGQSQSTVMIDGVEFEQVTLANGEVIVKLKEEVLEGCVPPSRILDSANKEHQTVPVTKRRQPHINQSKQVSNQNDQNGEQAQQYGHQSQVVSESLGVNDGLELKHGQHSDQDIIPQPINELKITSTTTLASTAWVPLSNKKLKITSSCSLASNISHDTSYQRDENPSPNTESVPKKAITADRKLATIRDQTVKVDVGSVDNMINSVSMSSNQVCQKVSDVLKSTDETNILVSDKKEAETKKPQYIDISDNEKDFNLTKQDARAISNKPAEQRTSSDFLERWSAELKRIAALPKTDKEQHGTLISGQQPTYTDHEITRDVSCDSRSADGHSHKGSPNLTPVKRVRTNGNTEVSKKPRDNLLSTHGQITSPNLTPTKRMRTNRNTIMAKNHDSSGSGSNDSQRTPGKMMKTNQNPVIRTNGSSDSCSDDDQEIQVKRVRTNRDTTVALIKRVKTNRTTIVNNKLTSHISKPVEMSSEVPKSTKLACPKNHETVVPADADEDKSFLLSLLPEMKSMTETQNFEFRLEIMQALSRAKYS